MSDPLQDAEDFMRDGAEQERRDRLRGLGWSVGALGAALLLLLVAAAFGGGPS